MPTPEPDKELTVEEREIIRELAGGAIIVCTDLGGYDGYEYELRRLGKIVSSTQINRLIDAGWLYSSNTSYRLTDEGKKAYLRSTDELGDGQLRLNNNDSTIQD